MKTKLARRNFLVLLFLGLSLLALSLGELASTAEAAPKFIHIIAGIASVASCVGAIVCGLGAGIAQYDLVGLKEEEEQRELRRRNEKIEYLEYHLKCSNEALADAKKRLDELAVKKAGE